MGRVTDETEIGAALADDDVIMVVDTSDTTDHSAGSSKKSLMSRIKTYILSALGISISGSDVTFTGNLFSKKCGLFSYLTTPKVVACAIANTYYLVAGTFSYPVIEQFTFLDPGVEYSGPTQTMEIDWHGTVSSSVNNTTVTVALGLNEVDAQTGSEMSVYCKTAGDKYSISGTYVVELTDEDQAFAILQSDVIANVTVHKAQITINEFFD